MHIRISIIVLTAVLCFTTACKSSDQSSESRRQPIPKGEAPSPPSLVVKASSKPLSENNNLLLEIEIRNSGASEVAFDTVVTGYRADGEIVFSTLQSIADKDGTIETTFLFPGKEGTPHNPTLFWKLPPGEVAPLSTEVPKGAEFFVNRESSVTVLLLKDGNQVGNFGPFPIDVGKGK